jgi:hypothetical protein
MKNKTSRKDGRRKISVSKSMGERAIVCQTLDVHVPADVCSARPF